MDTYLFSIQPKWCEKIFNGEKTIEVRKTAPKPPFKVVVYCTKDNKNKLYNNSGILTIDSTFCSIADSWIYPANGKVIGEFICDKVDTILCASTDHRYFSKCGTCLTEEEIRNYCNGNDIFGLHITDLKVYDEPKALHHFFKPCGDCSKKDTMRCTEESTDCRATTITRPPQSYMRIQDTKEEI